MSAYPPGEPGRRPSRRPRITNRSRAHYSESRPAGYHSQGGYSPLSLNDLSLDEVGLPFVVTAFISVMSLFPLVGLVIGSYYSSSRHYPTRSFGRILLAFAVFLHFMYVCVACPALAYFSFTQF
jgi:hypothetical protein